jgi:hypothetical protein
MCQYSATDGFANDWHLVHLGAVGGRANHSGSDFGFPEGRISPGDLGLWKDEQIEKMQQINRLSSAKTRFLESNWRMPEEKPARLYHGKAVRNLIPIMGVGNCSAKRNGFHDDETPIAWTAGIQK